MRSLLRDISSSLQRRDISDETDVLQLATIIESMKVCAAAAPVVSSLTCPLQGTIGEAISTSGSSETFERAAAMLIGLSLATGLGTDRV